MNNLLDILALIVVIVPLALLILIILVSLQWFIIPILIFTWGCYRLTKE